MADHDVTDDAVVDAIGSAIAARPTAVDPILAPVVATLAEIQAEADGGDPVDVTAATDTTPFGFTESQANGLLATVAAIRTALIAAGILVAD